MFKIRNQKLKNWLEFAVWNEAEFLQLCAGLDPHSPSDKEALKRFNQEMTYHLDEKVGRAVIAGELRTITPESTGFFSRESYTFKRDDAIAWAGPRFPHFPFELVPEDVESKIETSSSLLQFKEHHADKLRILFQAADRFWGPADPNNGALQPKSAEIEAWLSKNGFSPTLASHGAKIIRPDWAKDGRRPEDK